MKKVLFSALALFAAMTVSAQDITTLYNEAAAAYGAKNYTLAAEKFEQVIDLGIDDESAASMVATAKSTMPKCYYMLGGAAVRTQNMDEALGNFKRSAELAELYGDASQQAKANNWVAKIYNIKGGDAFNSKDFATAASIFQMGYDADPNNTGMALNLAMSYCELFMASGEIAQYEKGMAIYEAVAAKQNPKFAEDAAKAKEMIALYTNNMVAKLQANKDYDGIIAATNAMIEANPQNALAHAARLQAYSSKNDLSKVIELGEAAAAAQVEDADRSQMYFLLGAAYNAREMKDQALAAFGKVTAGANVDSAKAAIAELSK